MGRSRGSDFLGWEATAHADSAPQEPWIIHFHHFRKNAELGSFLQTPSHRIHPRGWIWRWIDGTPVQLAGLSETPDFDDEFMEGSDGAVVSQHESHVHQHHSHHYHEDPMDEVAVAIISSGTTMLFAMAGAALAMRLFRELVRPRSHNAEVVQVDIPGVQPFRPFAGQAYHLAHLSKPPSPRHAQNPEEKAEKDAQNSVTSPVSQALPSNTGATPLQAEDGATLA